MFAITDVAVQKLESRDTNKPWDARRTATQAAFGAYYGIVHAHLLWGALEKLFGSIAARGVVMTPLVGAMARVSIDQFLIGTPLFNTVFFYSTGRFAQSMTHEQAVQNVRDRLGSMLKLHWSFCKYTSLYQRWYNRNLRRQPHRYGAHFNTDSTDWSLVPALWVTIHIIYIVLFEQW